MNSPNKYQLALLSQAITYLNESDYSPYLKLKRLLVDQPVGFRVEFRQTFERYYGLNTGGVSDAFKRRYFELLFELELPESCDPYTPILKELYSIPRRLEDNALQCSFVSKLVAIHDETRPIFDRHVSDFFGITVPSSVWVDFRIAGFVTNLTRLRETYQHWSGDKQFMEILSAVKQKHPSLKNCTSTRVADFLVWTVGRKKLGEALVPDQRL
jgi:hypothetical protein